MPAVWLAVVLLLVMAWLPAAAAGAKEEASCITSANAARSLPRETLASGLPVCLDGVVLVHHLFTPGGGDSMLFVHDGTEGIYVNAAGLGTELAPGTSVRVRGRVVAGEFAPMVGEGHVEVLGEGILPAPRDSTCDALLSGAEDSQWIRLAGIIRAVSLVDGQIRFELAVGNREIPVYVAGHCAKVPPAANLVDAEVTVTGAGLTGFNPRGQILSSLMMTPSLRMVEVDAPPRPLADLPERSVDRLLSFTPKGVSGHRVKVTGIVTHCDARGSVYLRDGSCSLQAMSQSPAVFEPGTRVEAIGFPKPGLAAPFLDYTIFRVLGACAPPAPWPATDAQAMSGDYEAALVTIGGRLVEQTIGAEGLRLMMGDGEAVFPAKLALAPGQSPPRLEVGSHLQLTGIALTEGGVERREGAGFRPTAWHLKLRSPADVRILRRPGWWNMHRILTIAAVLAVVLLATFLWIVALRRKVAAQTAWIKAQAQHQATVEERNRIARELHDTLAQGFAGTAFTLEGIATMLQREGHPVRKHVELALHMVRHGLSEARRSVMNLRSEALEDRDLASALEETAHRLVEGSGIELETDLCAPAPDLSQSEQFHLFRIGVEALTNAVQHGKPRVLRLRLRVSGPALQLEVSDDGSGFDPGSLSGGVNFGVRGMRERAKLIHADFQLSSGPGSGTRVTVALPIGGARPGPPGPELSSRSPAELLPARTRAEVPVD